MKHLEEEVTVAVCRRCERTGHLSQPEHGYWCAWCGDRCEIGLRSVRVLTRETADRHMVDGEIVDPQHVPLQPLRITDGWTVKYNNGFYEVDPTPGTVQWWWIFKSDMVTMVHEHRNRLLDVSWTDEMDYEDGRYRLTLYEGDYRGEVLMEHEFRNRLELVEAIETVLQRVTNGAL